MWLLKAGHEQVFHMSNKSWSVTAQASTMALMVMRDKEREIDVIQVYILVFCICFFQCLRYIIAQQTVQLMAL